MLLRQTLLYLPAQVIGPVFQLISVVVWTHVISEHALGVITLITAAHELLQTVLLAWWSQYALRFLGRFTSGEDAARFQRTENAVIAGSIIAQGIVILVILLTVIAPDADAALMTASVAYVATRSLNLYMAERARVRGEILVYSVQQIAGPALGFLLGLLLIRTLGDGPEWALVGYAAVQLAAFIGVLPLISIGRRIGPFDRDILDHALRYGIPLIVGGGLGWVGLNASRFIIGEMQSIAAAGLFAVGYGLGQRAAAVAAMLVTTAAFPLAVKRMEEGDSRVAMRQLGENGALLAAILLPSIGGLYALREEIVRVLVAQPFHDATIAILPLAAAAGVARNFRSHFGDQVFLLHNRTRLSVLINGVEAVAVVLLGIALVWRMGLVGGAVASLAASLLAATLSFWIGLRHFALMLPLVHLARTGLATLAMMTGLGFLAPAGGIVALLLHVGAGVVLYVAALAVLYLPTLLRARPIPANADHGPRRWRRLL